MVMAMAPPGVMVWMVSGPLAMAYVYYGVMKLPRGALRLAATLPLMAFYVRSGHEFATVFERALYSFFFIWLTSFKLALLCWDKGPVADPWAMASFARFLAVMNLSLHIKRQNFAERSRKKSTVVESNGDGSWMAMEMPVVAARLLFKFVAVALMTYALHFRDRMHVAVVSLVYSFYIYVVASLIFESIAAVVSPMVGIELEPAFNKPFVAHSLADFWGKRWNLLVSNLLRVSIHDPVLRILLWKPCSGLQEPSKAVERSPVKSALWPRSVASFACFLASGLMHELIFYNMTRSSPTWEVTIFFVLNGAATALEGALRHKTKLRLPKLVSIPLTVSFVLGTAIWYFYPPLVDSGAADDSIAEFTYFFQKIYQLVGRS